MAAAAELPASGSPCCESGALLLPCHRRATPSLTTARPPLRPSSLSDPATFALNPPSPSRSGLAPRSSSPAMAFLLQRRASAARDHGRCCTRTSPTLPPSPAPRYGRLATSPSPAPPHRVPEVHGTSSLQELRLPCSTPRAMASWKSPLRQVYEYTVSRPVPLPASSKSPKSGDTPSTPIDGLEHLRKCTTTVG
ncbi:hypothetical protein TRIUR3_35260 [Triticum urartu]|uniref:Uncharacterized protein n=1 Tax=Triticum urartu TaxID=4572 RepID=M8ALJ9_TRIUA|nr:hypothetical protein TRIUR3_35260 [Triticum urartu]